MSEAAKSNKMPPGIPYIVGNEAAERFSFYGMRSILVIFMTKYLMDATGNPEFTGPEAMVWYHNFASANYAFPILGALISDIFWGKYRTILNLSIVYCIGHLVLALFETRTGLAAGLTLIAIGSGGIKPCVSAHVGDQFTAKNSHLIEKSFGWFYLSINIGAFFSTLLTPYLLHTVGPGIAFGVPGILMMMATVVFYSGRNEFVHIPPAGLEVFLREVSEPESVRSILNLLPVYFFVAFFWALYDQTGSSWVLQALKMDRMLDLGVTSFEILPSQVQAINPILILCFIPLFSVFIYPQLDRIWTLTPLRKIGIGLFITAFSFMMVAGSESLLEAGESVNIEWQILAFMVITAAEVMVSITALEFSYTQAPNTMKSLVMGIYLLTIALGNQITVAVNWFIQDENGNSTLSGSDYYWFFANLMLGAAVVYVFVAMFYKGRTYIQEELTKE